MRLSLPPGSRARVTGGDEAEQVSRSLTVAAKLQFSVGGSERLQAVANSICDNVCFRQVCESSVASVVPMRGRHSLSW